jgi:hypothetical protein
MPFLAAYAVGSAVAKKAGVHISLKTPSEKRARKVIPAVVASANSGNMAAVAILDRRRTSAGIQKERNEWEHGYSQIAASVLAKYLPDRAKYLAAIPASAQASPEAAASYATGTQITADSSPLEELAAPIVEAQANAEASLREGVAQAIERAGIGGAAAAAKQVRGASGTLDTVIGFAKKPAGVIVLVGGGVLLLIVVTALVARRR